MTMINPFAQEYESQTKGIPLGKNMKTKSDIFLSWDRLATHMHVIGPTGVGKSRFLQNVFYSLVHRTPAVPIVLIDPKGGLFEACRDWPGSSALTTAQSSAV